MREKISPIKPLEPINFNKKTEPVNPNYDFIPMFNKGNEGKFLVVLKGEKPTNTES